MSHHDDLIWNHKGFPNKTSEDEDIILLVREDIVLLILKGIGLYLIFFVFLILRVVVSVYADTVSLYMYDTLMYGVATILTVIFLITFHNYYLSLQIITTQRIIDIDQISLFRREISSTPIEKIDDVTHRKVNFANLLFNFGDVIVQTSGRSGTEDKLGTSGFVFNNVPNPEEVAHLIDNILQQNQRSDALQKARFQADELQKVLGRKTLN